MKANQGVVHCPLDAPPPHTVAHPGHLLTRLISIKAFLKCFPHGLSEFQQNWWKKGELQLKRGQAGQEMGATRAGCTMNAHGRLRRCPVVVALYSHYSYQRLAARCTCAHQPPFCSARAQLAKHRRGPRDIGFLMHSQISCAIVRIVGENR